MVSCSAGIFGRGSSDVGVAGASGDGWFQPTVVHINRLWFVFYRKAIHGCSRQPSTTLPIRLAFGEWSAGTHTFHINRITGYNGTTSDFTVMEIAQ